MDRGDTTGALDIVLQDPPYGPNADDAKVSSRTMTSGRSTTHWGLELDFANTRIDSEQHQVDRGYQRHQGPIFRRPGHVDEVFVQRDGYAWLGRC